MKRLLVVFLIIGVSIGLVGNAYAQAQLYLRSGKIIEGDIIERTDDYIKVDFSGVTLTYWMDEIERVEFEDGEVLSPGGGEEAEPEEEVFEEAEPEEEVFEEAEPEEVFEEAPEEEVFEEEPEEFDQGFEREQDARESSFEEPEPFSGGFEEEEEGFQAQGEDELIAKLKQMEKASRQLSKAVPGSPGFSSSSDMPDMPDEAMVQAMSGVLGVGMVIFFIFVYAYSAFCLQSIASKTGTKNAWFAWLPILNVLLMCDIAGKPRWWVLSVFLSAIPVVGALIFMVVWAILWMNIARARGKPAWLGILVFLPIVNFIVMGYLAFSKQDDYEPGVAGTNAVEESRRLREEAKKIRASGAVEPKADEAAKAQEKSEIVYRPRETIDDGRGTIDEKKEPVPFAEEIKEDVRDISSGAEDTKEEGPETTDEGRETKDVKPPPEPEEETPPRPEGPSAESPSSDRPQPSPHLPPKTPPPQAPLQEPQEETKEEGRGTTDAAPQEPPEKKDEGPETTDEGPRTI